MLDRNTSTFAYRDLPNGRYFEYYIQDACLEDKQVKSISYYYASGEGSGVGVDLLEDLEGRFIMQTNYCFDVKGGKVTEHKVKKSKSTALDALNTVGSIKSANNKIMKFYAKKLHANKISKRLFSKCISVRQRCDLQPRHFPFTIKEKLFDVYALYEENHPLPPPEVRVKRAEEIALEAIKEWHSQYDFALEMSK